MNGDIVYLKVHEDLFLLLSNQAVDIFGSLNHFLYKYEARASRLSLAEHKHNVMDTLHLIHVLLLLFGIN